MDAGKEVRSFQIQLMKVEQRFVERADGGPPRSAALAPHRHAPTGLDYR